VSGVRSPNLN